MSETPKDGWRRLAASAMRDGYRPEALHTYTDAHGEPLYWRIRLKHPATGEKWIRPMHRYGGEFKAGEPPAPANGKPLYRLHKLAQAPRDAPVFVVEGEWCADKLAALGLTVTTSGGKSSAEGTDWTPLAGRCVVLWPDFDRSGFEYAEAVHRLTASPDNRVMQLDVSALGLPEKGDAVDWLAMHPNASASDVLNLPMNKMAAPQSDGVELLCMADVTPRAVDWLWDGWLARGKLHILAGSPGTGKTTIALALAGTVSNGGRWPNGEQSNEGAPMNVLVWSGEDDPTDTLVPRLMAAGADLTRCHAVQAVQCKGERVPFDPAHHMPELAARMEKLGNVGLVIIDPIVSAVAGDSHKNSEVRRALEPLVRFGHDFGCAIVGISHFSKGTGSKDPTERVTGSIAFGALARVVLATVKPREDGEPRLLLRTKSNIGKDSGGFAYELGQVELAEGVTASRVLWGEAVEGSARELMGEAEGIDGERQDREDAAEWLTSFLDTGPMPSKQVKAAAEDAGHAWRTVQRAKRSLGVEDRRGGFGKEMKTVWSLPQSRQKNPLAPHNLLGANGATGANERDREVFDL